MAKPALNERLVAIREAAGYGGTGKATKFAGKIGISAAALHNLESGISKKLEKAWEGYLRLGANPFFILDGVGGPMWEHQLEREFDAQTLMSIYRDLEEEKPGSTSSDPFKQKPPPTLFVEVSPWQRPSSHLLA